MKQAEELAQLSERGVLLLARGACIETSIQESRSDTARLLLARGACIETGISITPPCRYKLLLARGACIETQYVQRDIVQELVAPRKRSMY